MKVCTLALSHTENNWFDAINKRAAELRVPLVGLVNIKSEEKKNYTNCISIFDLKQGPELQQTLSQFDIVLVASEGCLPSTELQHLPILPVLTQTQNVFGFYLGEYQSIVSHTTARLIGTGDAGSLQFMIFSWQNPGTHDFPRFDCTCSVYRAKDFIDAAFRPGQPLAGISSLEANGCEYLRTLQGFNYLTSVKSLAERTDFQPLDYTSKKSCSSHPVVSVILPTKDRPELLERALISLLNQTFADFEVVLVNDGGKRPESKLLNMDARIRYVEHGVSRGLASARNTGLKAARGQFIAYLDDDDIFWPRHLEMLVDKINESGTSLVYSKSLRFWTEKNQIIKRDSLYSNKLFSFDNLLEGNFMPVINILHTRQLVEEVGYFDSELSRVEDWDLWLKCALKTDFALLDIYTCEFAFPVDGGSMTASGVASFMWHEFIVRAKHMNIIQADSLKQRIVHQVTERDLTRVINYLVEARFRNKGSLLQVLKVKDAQLFQKQVEFLMSAYPAFSSTFVDIKREILNSISFNEEIERYKNALLQHRNDGKVSIVMPLYNAVEFTRAAIESLNRHTNMSSVEVILVDNASTDQTSDFLNELENKPGFKIIRNAENRNFSGACNQGADAASYENIVFLNNDVLLTDGWLENMLDVLQDPSVGIVGNKQLFGYSGKLHHCGVFLDKGIDVHHYLLGMDADDPRASFRRDFQIVTGSCLLIRRELLRYVNGFDLHYINGMEDCCLCLKVRELGFRVVYTPDSLIYHFVSQSPGRSAHNHRNSEIHRNIWNGIIKTDLAAIVDEDKALVNKILIKSKKKKRLGFIIDSALPSFAGLMLDPLWSELMKSHSQYFSDYDPFMPIFGHAVSDLNKQDNLWWYRCPAHLDYAEYVGDKAEEFEIDQIVRLALDCPTDQRYQQLHSLTLNIEEIFPDYINPFLDFYSEFSQSKKSIERVPEVAIAACINRESLSQDFINELVAPGQRFKIFCIELDSAKRSRKICPLLNVTAENGGVAELVGLDNSLHYMALSDVFRTCSRILVSEQLPQAWRNIFAGLAKSYAVQAYSYHNVITGQLNAQEPNKNLYPQWAMHFSSLLKSKL